MGKQRARSLENEMVSPSHPAISQVTSLLDQTTSAGGIRRSSGGESSGYLRRISADSSAGSSLHHSSTGDHSTSTFSAGDYEHPGIRRSSNTSSHPSISQVKSQKSLMLHYPLDHLDGNPGLWE